MGGCDGKALAWALAFSQQGPGLRQYFSHKRIKPNKFPFSEVPSDKTCNAQYRAFPSTSFTPGFCFSHHTLFMGVKSTFPCNEMSDNDVNTEKMLLSK